MKVPARGRVSQRRRIFSGCEGESEQSYGALLGYLADEGELHIHIDNVLLRPGGGDPLALIEIAVRQIRLRSERRGPYSVKAALLDSDLIGRSPDRDERARGLARANGLDLLWQQPCHEGLLLRHLEGCHAMRPATFDDAAAALKANWPEFYKAMPASRLRTRFDTASILRAASVEHDLRRFLKRLGFPAD